MRIKVGVGRLGLGPATPPMTHMPHGAAHCYLTSGPGPGLSLHLAPHLEQKERHTYISPDSQFQ